MFPYIHLGSFQLGTFGLMMWLAAVVGAFLLHQCFVRARLSADAVVVVSTVMIAGVIGAKLWHELQDPAALRDAMLDVVQPGLSHPLEIATRFLHWFQAGFAWFGGLLFGIAALLWQGRSTKVGTIRMLDLSAVGAAVGYGVGRIGCLLSGDGDYGITTTHWWGVHIRPDALDPPRPDPPGLLVEPTPIYEFLFGLGLGWYLWVRGRKALPIGQITGEYLVLSGIARFLVEFIRRNPKLYFGMSNAQVAALGTIVIGAVVIAVARSRNAVPESEPSAAV